MDNMIICNNCGTTITDESSSVDPTQRRPCPVCGSLARSYTIELSPGRYELTGGEVSMRYIPYSETLLETSRRLITEGEFSIATVVAHMACEISAERAISQTLSRIFAEKGITYLEKPVLDLATLGKLHYNPVRNLYNAATGSELHRQPFWPGFKASVTRRNKAVHEGRVITKAEAEDSLKVASDLIAFLQGGRALLGRSQCD